MSTDNLDELIPFDEAAALAPRRKRPIVDSTINRWAREGKRVRGELIFLEHRAFGAYLFTTRRWLEDFSRACAIAGRRRRQPAAAKPPPTPAPLLHPGRVRINAEAHRIGKIRDDLAKWGI